MFTEDELLPISALSHLLFCERRCALVHVEQVWNENRFTVEGTNLHAKVHDADDESRGDLRLVRGLRLRSLRLGSDWTTTCALKPNRPRNVCMS